MPLQLDFFPDMLSEAEEVRRELMEEIEKIQVSSTKVRKGIYAKHGELSKLYLQLVERVDIIERNICKGNPHA